ncbi:hypothetical protein V6N11_077902 [Hibiscus sabdariffa]|uniref:Uncharacterized protein n=1 Tax=Hibiscus sabdariffa TaxID=183260 RepID=A0ABR2TEE9_9ROSI
MRFMSLLTQKLKDHVAIPRREEVEASNKHCPPKAAAGYPVVRIGQPPSLVVKCQMVAEPEPDINSRQQMLQPKFSHEDQSVGKKTNEV